MIGLKKSEALKAKMLKEKVVAKQTRATSQFLLNKFSATKIMLL